MGRQILGSDKIKLVDLKMNAGKEGEREREESLYGRTDIS